MYEYRCPRGHISERHRPFSEYKEATFCTCGETATRVILSPPKVFGDYEGYESPASGKWIEGRKARERDFAETGTRPYEIGERADAIRRAAAAERELDRTVDEVVDQTLSELTS